MLQEDSAGSHPEADAVFAVRSRVSTFLWLFANLEIDDFGRLGQSRERIAYELCRLWFAEIYPPGLRYIDGLKGDRDAEAVALFADAFEAEELDYFERFNRFIELRLDMMPRSTLTRKEVDPERWRAIARDARNTLDLVEPAFVFERSRIGAVLRLAGADIEFPTADGDYRSGDAHL